MLSISLLTVAALAASANAHFRVVAPTWRGSSFEEPASQWIYPCANVNETTDMANRKSPLLLSLPSHPSVLCHVHIQSLLSSPLTHHLGTLWPPSGGSTIINGSHTSALTSVNLALGSNATNFNITLLPMFNQTGAGIFCMKETGRTNLEEGFKAAGYSGLDDERIEGLMATVQIIQLGHSGAALYNVSLPACKMEMAWD
jgi:hypothetical protein